VRLLEKVDRRFFKYLNRCHFDSVGKTEQNEVVQVQIYERREGWHSLGSSSCRRELVGGREIEGNDVPLVHFQGSAGMHTKPRPDSCHSHFLDLIRRWEQEYRTLAPAFPNFHRTTF
jgi:hypothetical protein